ncbi:MAG: hypothetical protein L3J02_06490, partial [Henriciella sp.]|nr:hypothetical protein [Henriciella sp.]
MADGLTKRIYGNRAVVGVNPATAATPVLAASNPADVSDAHLPDKRTPVSAGTLRRIAHWLDVAVAVLISWYCLALSGTNVLAAPVFDIIPFVLIPLTLSWGLRTASAYDFGLNRGVLDQMLRAANGAGLPLAILGSFTYLVYQSHGARWPILAALLSWLAIIALHAHMLFFIRRLIRAGRLSENVVIVGATPNAQRLIARNQVTRELNIVGVFDDRLSRAPKSVSGAPLLGRLDDLLNYIPARLTGFLFVAAAFPLTRTSALFSWVSGKTLLLSLRNRPGPPGTTATDGSDGRLAGDTFVREDATSLTGGDIFDIFCACLTTWFLQAANCDFAAASSALMLVFLLSAAARESLVACNSSLSL